MKKAKNITGICSWPEEDRPREKLLKKGAGALSNSELLAILLRTGTHGTSAIDLARKILKKFGTFRNMAHTDSRDWKDLKGLGGAKIAHIQAALEIGRRYREDDVINRCLSLFCNTLSGKPLGDASFIQKLERIFGKALKTLPRGRPRKK